MNLRRGLFRLWLVASCAWCVGWLIYFGHTCQPRANVPLIYCRLLLLNDWVHHSENFTVDDYLNITLSGLAVPVAAFILGLAGLWAVEGFKTRSKPN
jgi:hypothetical protein